MQNIKELSYKLKAIGQYADQSLLEADEISVINVISGGVFLIVNYQNVIFASYGKHRSPITLNLQSVIRNLELLPSGSKVSNSIRALYFPLIRSTIYWEPSDIWSPPLAVANPLTTSERLHLLKELANFVLANKMDDLGFAPLLCSLIEVESDTKIPEELSRINLILPDLKRAFLTNNIPHLVQLFQTIIGLGRGLTPSGDDFTAGILLALNRWPKIILPEFSRGVFGENLTDLARNKTTKLSATIIEQSTHGQGDERLISALDLMMTGKEDFYTTASEIIKLGHSSGVDTIVGMALVLCISSN